MTARLNPHMGASGVPFMKTTRLLSVVSWPLLSGFTAGSALPCQVPCAAQHQGRTSASVPAVPQLLLRLAHEQLARLETHSALSLQRETAGGNLGMGLISSCCLTMVTGNGFGR